MFHPSRGIKHRSQLLLTDGMGADIGTIVTKTQHIEGSTLFGYRRQARHVIGTLVVAEGMESSTVRHRLKSALQTLQVKRVRRSELGLDSAVVGFFARHRERSLSYIYAQNR